MKWLIIFFLVFTFTICNTSALIWSGGAAGNGTTVNNYYNITGGNGTGMNYTNVALTNQTTTWNAGKDIVLGIGGYFKGAFNWVISSLVPSSYATFNGTTLWINTTYFYNQTIAGGSGFNATYDTHINNLTQHNSTYWYNQTYSGSTYNATYAQWAYNQSGGSTGNFVQKTGDVMTGDLNLSNDAKIKSNDSGSYFGYTRENKFVFVYKK